MARPADLVLSEESVARERLLLATAPTVLHLYSMRGLSLSIEDSRTIDFVALDDREPVVRLIISDHLPWQADASPHLWLLQEKLNTGLAYIESGQLRADYPRADGWPIRFEIHAKHAPNAEAEAFCLLAQGALREAGYGFAFSLLQTG